MNPQEILEKCCMLDLIYGRNYVLVFKDKNSALPFIPLIVDDTDINYHGRVFCISTLTSRYTGRWLDDGCWQDNFRICIDCDDNRKESLHLSTDEILY